MLVKCSQIVDVLQDFLLTISGISFFGDFNGSCDVKLTKNSGKIISMVGLVWDGLGNGSFSVGAYTTRI